MKTSLIVLVLPLLGSSCGGTSDDSGNGGGNYCETCNLDDQIPLLAAEGATDCGQVGIGEDPSAVTACVEQALADGTPFIARQQHQGIDSASITAWVVDADGVVQRVGYDSNICGGFECNEQCGPRVSTSECGNARVGAMPEDALVDCDSGAFATVCEPPE